MPVQGQATINQLMRERVLNCLSEQRWMFTVLKRPEAFHLRPSVLICFRKRFYRNRSLV